MGYRPELSRRDFLKVGGFVGLTTWAALKIRANWDDLSLEAAKLGLEKESVEKIQEIVNFRRSLKLKDLPGELVPAILDQKKWDDETEDFDNRLPDENLYASSAQNVVETILGKNTTRLIKGIQIIEQIPDYVGFYAKLRKALIGPQVKLPLGVFIDTMVHELIGHASDPAVAWERGEKANKTIYPADTLVSVEHGKWQALSRSFAVEGQFFNHPEDMMYPYISKKIGETAARYFLRERKWPLSITESDDDLLIYNSMKRAAISRGTTLDELRFNKSVCREIGNDLIKHYLAGEITFLTEIKDIYEKEMELALIEIYAEMVRLSIVHPSLIQSEPEIANGVSEILEAINGKPVDLGELRNKIYEKGGLEDINAIEEPVMKIIEIPYQTLNTGEKISVDQILNSGLRPVEKLQTLREIIILKYPQLTITNHQQYNTSFDPFLHSWEIEEIEWAIDSVYFGKFDEGTQKEEDIKEIETRLNVLRDFIESDAF